MLRALVLAAFLLLAMLWTFTRVVASKDAQASLRNLAESAPAFNPAARSALTTTTGIPVTTFTDEFNEDGDCSLREAIHAAYTDAVVDGCPASTNNTVFLPAGNYLLTMGSISLNGTITFQGSITGTSILDGNFQDRVLIIGTGSTVRLLHLDIRNGRGPTQSGSEPLDGGGILNYGTSLIADSVIQNNQAGSNWEFYVGGDGGNGGGIANEGTLTLINSTMSGNSSGHGGCGINHSGEPVCEGSPKPGTGGAIANSGVMTLENSTITNNGGIQGVGGVVQLGGIVRVKNSILAGNNGSDCGGIIISLGYSLIQSTGGCTISGDFIHWGASLGPLQDNGGPTFTHDLQAKSPAIDAGSCVDIAGITVTVDQRGEPRPQGEGCDIGAYESPYTSTFTVRDMSLPAISR